MASFNGPKLTNPIRKDVPDTQEVLVALVKQDPTSISDIPVGAKRLYEASSGKWQWQEYNGSSWAAVPFLQHNVDQLDGYHAAITPAANTVAVRNASGLLQDSITGNAATASSAATLSQTLPVNKGGTGATTSEAARSNLGVPPTSHANTNTTYGVGNATQYGHLKLSDAANSSSGVSGGVAATPAAVKAAKDAADAAQSSANNAMTKASTLATSSTPGIVKPGTGLQIGEEGAMNVVAEQTGCLPLTGGTMTGNIKVFYNGELGELAGSNFNSEYRYVILSALGTNPASFLALRQDSPGLGGAFICRAMDSYGSMYDLVGRNDGTLTWRDSSVLLPPGAVFAFAGHWITGGCLICNGAEVSRTTYADLFTAIGTTYGYGDGSTTFNLPNLTDRFIQGSGTAGTYLSAGVPNITGKFAAANYGTAASGAFYEIPTLAPSQNGGNHNYNSYAFAASRSSEIYGKSATVQPPALTMRYYIKY